jgi:putative redox protein
MRSEVFNFESADGRALSGRLDLPDGPVRTYAVFAHCFTCSKSSLAAVRIGRALAAMGVGVLRFDFTGLGDSEGDLAASGFSGEVADLTAAVVQMTAAGYAPSLLIGHSLGGAAALAAAPDMPGLKAVATIGAPFDPAHVERLFGDKLGDLEANGQAEVNLGGRNFLLSRGFVEDLRAQDQGRRILGLKKALLILHSPIDAIVGVENASEIFLAARHPKSFISLDRADHLLSHAGDAEYAASVIAAWAERYIPTPAAAPGAAATDGAVVVETTGAGKFQVKITAGDEVFYADEPPEVGGAGTGPTPYGLMAAALGACTAMTLRLYAGQKDIPLTGVKVRVTHAKDATRTPPDVFSRELTVLGDLSEDQRARLLQIADRCPVHRSLERGVAVETMLTEQPKPTPPPDGPDQHCQDMQAACDEVP